MRPSAGLALVAVWLAAAATMAGETNPAAAAPTVCQAWSFAKDGDRQGWVANGHLEGAAVAGGAIRGRVIDWDPMFVSPVFDIRASHSQQVEIRMRAERKGRTEVFWTNTLQGRYGGFRPTWQTPFDVVGDGRWRVYRVRCGWGPLGKIVRLRLDLPGTRGRSAKPPLYEVSSIRIVDAPPAAAPQSRPDWTFADGPAGWTVQGRGAADVQDGALRLKPTNGPPAVLLAPAVRFPADEHSLLHVRMSATAGAEATLGFAVAGQIGWTSHAFPIRSDGTMRSYLVDLAGVRAWRGGVAAMTFQPTDAGTAAVRIESIQLARRPTGEPELEIAQLALADVLPRAGQELCVSALVRNRGAGAARQVKAILAPPVGLRVLGPAEQALGDVWYGESRLLRWRVRAEDALDAEVRLTLAGAKGPAARRTARLQIGPSLGLPKADYVPPPKPAKTPYQVGVYYFPGWSTIDRWRPIFAYPERKPVLGWYDESRPEVADWQIKWAVEHGITFFAVDWYWCRGARHLEHWLHKAYFRSRYRTQLKFCLLWANHNPPGSHDHDDFLAVTDYWIEHYFRRPEHLTIDGKPVVVIFTPYRITKDMKTDAAVARAFEAMRQRCRRAGLKGLYIVACTRSDLGTLQRLRAQGYDAASGYNYPDLGSGGRIRAPYADLLAPHVRLWNQVADAKLLKCIPAVSGGWDSRPWHGPTARARTGRTPELFEKHLRDVKAFLDKRGAEQGRPAKMCLIEAWNEWGEGSYIGPHRQYGFGYLEAVRRVFAPDSPNPAERTPRDLGLGPYDLPIPPATIPSAPVWDFAKAADRNAWPIGTQVRRRDDPSAIAGTTTGRDPILTGPTVRIPAERARWLVLRMQVDRDEAAQVFWSTTTSGMCENNSVRIPLTGGTERKTYRVDLAKLPYWRGLVTRLRLDPANREGVRFAIAGLRFEEDTSR